MLHLSTSALRFQVCGLQLEIPFCWTVRVIDQHEMWIVLQSLSLQFHGAAVLFDELGEDKFQQLRAEGHPMKDIPGGNYVDATSVAGDGSDRGEAREPVLPCPDDFSAQIRQNKIDSGGDGVG